MQKIITREEARRQGLKRFFTGEPCGNGHTDERFVSGGQCIECMREYDRRKIAELREASGGKNTFFTGKPCRYGHVAERFIAGRMCVQCAAERGKAGYEERKAKAQESGGLTYWSDEPCAKGHVGLRYKSTYGCVQCVRASARHWQKNSENGKAYVKRHKRRWRRTTEAGKANVKRRLKAYFLSPKGQATIRRNKLKYYARQMKACPPWADIDAILAIFKACPGEHHTDHIVPLRGVTADGYRISGLHVQWNLQYLPRLENIHKHNRMRRHEQDLCERIPPA